MSVNYKNLSLVDVAYLILKERTETITFNELYQKVVELKELTDLERDENISLFFTHISLDGRFVALKNNEWDLRERQTYDKVHIDLNDIYEEIDSDALENLDEEEIDEDDRNLHLGDEDDDDVDDEAREETDY